MQKRIVVLGGVGFIGTCVCVCWTKGTKFSAWTRATSPIRRCCAICPRIRNSWPPQHRPPIRNSLRRDLQSRLATPACATTRRCPSNARSQHAGLDKRPRHLAEHARIRLGGNIYTQCRDAEESGFYHAPHSPKANAPPRRCTAPIRTEWWTPHCPHIQHLRHRRRPDGSARGDENDRGGVAEPRHSDQRRRTAADLLLGRRHRGRAGAADGRPPTETARTINFGSSHEVSIRALAEKIVALTGSSRSWSVHRRPRRRRAASRPTSRRRANWDGARTPPMVEGCAARSATPKRARRQDPCGDDVGGDKLNRIKQRQ